MTRFLVTLPDRQAHQLHVRLTVERPAGATGPLALGLPVWTPGSYLVREFSRNVLDLSATDASGAPLAVTKRDKNTWEVAAGSARTVQLDYELYANERSVRTSHVDADHAFLSPAGTFLFVRGADGRPAPGEQRVRIEAPAGWSVFCALPVKGGELVAPDYDTLVDSPIEVGPHRVLEFANDGVPFRIVLAGDGTLDEARLREDVAKLVDEVAAVFGQQPYPSYTFFLELVDAGGGGLEHADCSVNMVSRWNFGKKKEYRDLLGLLAHEFFHAWNVKRFRPAALGPFDYDRENYTPDLWVAEGVTSYVDDLCVVRAGFYDKPGEWLDAVAASYKETAELPGARRMSLSRASQDTWIKFYRPDENSRNSSVSYYSKGALVALQLDLRIRRLSGGARSLQDALRLGWQRYTAKGQGYPAGALQALAAETADADLADFFAAYVDGTEPLAPDEDLAFVGLQLKRTPSKTERNLPKDADGFALEPWLGLVTATDGPLCKVTGVLEDGPAWRAGLNTDDQILAVDGQRVAQDTLQDRLDRAGAEPLEISFFRGQSLRTLTLTPEARRLEDWKLAPIDAPSDAQKAAFKAWTGQELPAAGAPASVEAPDGSQAR
ncbi:MAG TPA: PDZ domain-containing protein [Planctomycetota bacterium]|nr:PDZ domain-containing protein [Planctomycetota bacterium]